MVKGIELDEIEGIAVELAVKQAWLVITTGCSEDFKIDAAVEVMVC